MSKIEAITRTIELEGGFVDDPSDSGGATNYGITEMVARKVGYEGHMRDLSKDEAVEIYETMYWDKCRCDDMPYKLAEKVFDTGVNMGTTRASMFLQRALSVMGYETEVDGYIGNHTIMALDTYLENRDVSVLVKCINCLQGAHYISLAERRPKDKRFVYGWIRNRIQ